MFEIAVVTPSWNRASLLGRLWESLKYQQANFQWVIVDDGSTDNTSQIVDEFNDARIKFERLPKNMGVNSARNKGVEVAEANYIIFLDSDDEIVPNALAGALQRLKNTDSDIGVACFACVMAESGKQTSKLIDGSILGEREVVCKSALRGGDNAYIYKKKIFEELKLPADLRGCEHVFVYAVSKKWRFLVVDMPVTLVHRQLDNLSDASSLISRSKDIAKSYELILLGHKDILAGDSAAKSALYRKCIYRYGVAGEKLKVMRLAIYGLETGSFKERFKTLGLVAFAMMPLGSFEFWRISRINKQLEKRNA